MTAEQHDSAYQTKNYDDEYIHVSRRVIDTMLALGATPRDLAVYQALVGASVSDKGCHVMSRTLIARQAGVKSKRSVDAAIEYLESIGLVVKRMRFVNSFGEHSSTKDDEFRKQVSSSFDIQNDEFVEANKHHLRRAH